MNENKEFDKILKSLFDKFDVNKILDLVNCDEKIIIKVIYCQYCYLTGDFIQAESLSISNIKDAKKLIGNPMTEDLGWLLIRRSLLYFSQKYEARKALNDITSTLKKDYVRSFRN